MSDLYHLWVENYDGDEYCDDIIVDDNETAQEIRKRLNRDYKVADYTFEFEKPVFSLTPDEVMEELEQFLSGGIP